MHCCGRRATAFSTQSCRADVRWQSLAPSKGQTEYGAPPRKYALCMVLQHRLEQYRKHLDVVYCCHCVLLCRLQHTSRHQAGTLVELAAGAHTRKIDTAFVRQRACLTVFCRPEEPDPADADQASSVLRPHILSSVLYWLNAIAKTSPKRAMLAATW